jgi:hypothetical protein
MICSRWVPRHEWWAGQFSAPLRAPKYPTHWNLDWIKRTLGHTTDQQLLHITRSMWINGIDLMDGTPFLMGLGGNLYSAYGLERPSSTASAAAQAMADKVAAELHTFHTPAPGKPQLYILDAHRAVSALRAVGDGQLSVPIVPALVGVLAQVLATYS